MSLDPATLHALAAFPRQLEQFYAAIPPAFTHWSPPSWDGIPSESFTAIEQICHVRDIEIDGYQQRLRRTLEEDAPVLDSLDGYALARERNYAAADANEVFAVFRDARAATVQSIIALDAQQLRRTAMFDDYGLVTLRSLVHALCSHDQQHLAGLQWLLAKIDALSIRA